MTADKIPLGEYIFRRLYGLGIRHIFGVPGDFNLNLLDHLDSVDGLHWIGTRNELNGAYAADGYARVRGLPGVLITTYGVGELSAINGIGGAVAEWVPIIHIVGMTARGVQKARLMIHHTLGEGVDHGIFREISKPVSAATAFLGDDATFTDEVDRVIEVCCKTKLPVYLYVPIDTPDILVDAGRLQTPLETAITNQGKEDVEDSIVDKIVDHLQKAQKPSVLVDLLTQRFGLTASVRELLSLTGLVGFTTPLAKSVIDETSENFGGLYMGSPTPSVETRDAIQSSDLVIIVGRFPSDSNTGGFAYTFSPEATVIALHPKYVSIGDKRWDDMSFVPIVQKLLDRVKSEKVTIHRWTKPRQQPQQTSSNGITGPLRQAHFWQTFNPYLRENDCVIAEVGSSQFGTLDLKLPRNATYYTQIYYSCIGFTVGATLGTLVARREQGIDGRVILFVGDGSLQMTVQEISTIIHNGFSPTIVVINNNGYTVERVIHGPARKYNDIDPWNYQAMLQFFGGASSENTKSHAARTYEELTAVLSNPDFQASRHIQVLECVLDRYDSPRLLSELVDRNAARQAVVMAQDDRANKRERKKIDGTLTESGLSKGL